MIYIFLFILCIDILRISNHFTGFFPSFITYNYEKTKFVTAFTVLAVSILIVSAGYINACIPRISKLELAILKPAAGLKTLRIAVATDIHLGVIVSNSRLEKLVQAINGINPDIILLAGDILDEDVRPVIKNNLGDILVQLKVQIRNIRGYRKS